MKVIIEIDELAGCEIQKDGETVFFETLDRQEQIHVCNAFVQFYNLFAPFIKKEGGQDDSQT